MKIKQLVQILLINLVILMGFSAPYAAALSVSNVGLASKSAACGSLNVIDSNQSCGSGSSFTGIFSTVVSILSIVVGVVAIIMIIVSGIKFITSSGDANKAASARTTLIYALIGVAVAALAQVMVHFVLNRANSVGP